MCRIAADDAAVFENVNAVDDETEDGRKAEGNGYEHRERVADGDKADEGSAEAGEHGGHGDAVDDRRVVARAVGRVIGMRAKDREAGDVEPDGVRASERNCPGGSEGGDHGDSRGDRVGDGGECESRAEKRYRDERGDAFGFRHRIGTKNGGRGDAEAARQMLNQALSPHGDEPCHQSERNQAEANREFHVASFRGLAFGDVDGRAIIWLNR